MTTIDKLIPVKLYNKVEIDKQYIGKVISIPVLEAKDRTIICHNLPAKWSIYIREAINNYYKTVKSKSSQPESHTINICSFIFPGRPIEMKDGKTISKDKNGMLLLSVDREYSNRISKLQKMRKEIVDGRTKLIPIDYSVTVECVFNIKRTKKSPSLMQLVASTVDLMVRMKILKNDSCDIVSRTDGSRICYTDENEHTVITIKRTIGGQ